MKTRFLIFSMIALLLASCNDEKKHNGAKSVQEELTPTNNLTSLKRSSISENFKALDIPDGYDWPRESSYIFEITKNVNEVAQREHGWHLFAGVTSPSDPDDASSLPVFQTWYGEDETFASEEEINTEEKRFFSVKMSPSTQFLMTDENPVKNAVKSTGIIPEPRWDPDLSQFSDPDSTQLLEGHNGPAAVFSHVAFNEHLHNFIRDNKYYSRKELNSLIDVNVARKRIKPTPKKSVSVKMSWWPVAKDQLTAIPVWDFDPRYPGDAKNYPKDWKRVVVVDPTGNHDAPESIEFNKRTFSNPNKVGLERFYYEQLTEEEVKNANANWRIKVAAKLALGRELQAGDYVVMVAMHINTVEFSPWVFTTFWWHDQPNDGEWAMNRTSDVKGKWANYLMGVSYNINTPREADGGADIVYNPYLELFQRGGMRSACMSCHARASYTSRAINPRFRAHYNPKTPGTDDPNGFKPIPDGVNDPAFQKGTLDLNTIWTIYTRSNRDDQ